MPRALPLFPLPLVLFPGAALPLHVFEPRYRRLLADVLADDRRFGVVLCEDAAAEGALPAGWVGCEAVVESLEALADGRANVLVRGGERFALERYLPAGAAPYHVAVVDAVRDVEEPAALVDPIAERTRALFARVAAAARRLADDTDAAPDLPDAPDALAFAIAGLVDFDVATRQRVLASRSAAARLLDLEALLAGALGALESRAEVHLRAKTNGRAGHHAH